MIHLLFTSLPFFIIFLSFPLPSSPFQFNATDKDSGAFGNVTYSITSASEDGVFSVDAVSGILSVVAPLDRETEDHYSLVITARDGGNLYFIICIFNSF